MLPKTLVRVIVSFINSDNKMSMLASNVSMACKASRKVPFFSPNALALVNFLNRVSVMDASEESY
jgi:hypothetical protein